MVKNKTVNPLEGELQSNDCDKQMRAMILSVVFGNIKKEVKQNPEKAIEMLDEFQDKLFEIMGINTDAK